MPFNLLLSVWIVFLVVARSPVILATASQSNPFDALMNCPTRTHAYKHKINAILAIIKGAYNRN